MDSWSWQSDREGKEDANGGLLLHLGSHKCPCQVSNMLSTYHMFSENSELRLVYAEEWETAVAAVAVAIAWEIWIGRQEIYKFIGLFIGWDDCIAAQLTDCVVCSRKVEINYGSRRGDLKSLSSPISCIFYIHSALMFKCFNWGLFIASSCLWWWVGDICCISEFTLLQGDASVAS